MNYHPARNRQNPSQHKVSIDQILEPTAEKNYTGSYKKQLDFEDSGRLSNHPLDSFPNTGIIRNNGKRINSNNYDEPRMSIQEQLRNHSNDTETRRHQAHRNPLVDERSASRFNLDENRAHNPHENATAQAKLHVYEQSPQKSQLQPNKRCFLQKISEGEYQGVLRNKNESRGFDRYVSDCKLHLDTAL